MQMLLATINLRDPILWAVLVAWIMSVVLHEFAHGLVAYLGGDYTIKERGGLTLNPLQYIDPMLSIALPVLFVILGGIPLPGGVTYIRRDLLRNRAWESGVSLAGPAMNFLLFVLLALPFHPRLGWISWSFTSPSNLSLFLSTLAQLQFISVILNLMPIPPLDGFGIISPYFDQATKRKLSASNINTIGLLVLFMVVWRIPGLFPWIYEVKNRLMHAMGYDVMTLEFFRQSYNHVLFGESMSFA